MILAIVQRSMGTKNCLRPYAGRSRGGRAVFHFEELDDTTRAYMLTEFGAE